MERLGAPDNDEQEYKKIRSIAGVKFVNSWYTSMKLLVDRELLLWWRDKYQLKVKTAQSKLWSHVFRFLHVMQYVGGHTCHSQFFFALPF